MVMLSFSAIVFGSRLVNWLKSLTDFAVTLVYLSLLSRALCPLFSGFEERFKRLDLAGSEEFLGERTGDFHGFGFSRFTSCDHGRRPLGRRLGRSAQTRYPQR